MRCVGFCQTRMTKKLICFLVFLALFLPAWIASFLVLSYYMQNVPNVCDILPTFDESLVVKYGSEEKAKEKITDYVAAAKNDIRPLFVNITRDMDRLFPVNEIIYVKDGFKNDRVMASAMKQEMADRLSKYAKKTCIMIHFTATEVYIGWSKNLNRYIPSNGFSRTYYGDLCSINEEMLNQAVIVLRYCDDDGTKLDTFCVSNVIHEPFGHLLGVPHDPDEDITNAMRPVNKKTYSQKTSFSPKTFEYATKRFFSKCFEKFSHKTGANWSWEVITWAIVFVVLTLFGIVGLVLFIIYRKELLRSPRITPQSFEMINIPKNLQSASHLPFWNFRASMEAALLWFWSLVCSPFESQQANQRTNQNGNNGHVIIPIGNNGESAV